MLLRHACLRQAAAWTGLLQDLNNTPPGLETWRQAEDTRTQRMH
jgi:hypothetical protein